MEKAIRGVNQLHARIEWSDGTEGEDSVLPKESDVALSLLKFTEPAKKKAKCDEKKLKTV